jgi:hypothetical protein
VSRLNKEKTPAILALKRGDASAIRSFIFIPLMHDGSHRRFFIYEFESDFISGAPSYSRTI